MTLRRLRARLAGARLAGARLADARLADASIGDARPAASPLADARLTDARLADAGLADAGLADAPIGDVRHAAPPLAAAHLAAARLTDAGLADAHPSKVRPDEARPAEAGGGAVGREPARVPSGGLARAASITAEPWAVAHDPAATLEDIFYCFRLILGRSPNPEEWRGHSSRIGERLDGVVASYVNSLEFARRGLSSLDHSDAMELVELPGRRMFVDPDDAAVGRHVQHDSYEPDVTAVFRRVLAPGMGVVDIGANIGYFTMLSASLVGADGFVLAVEPNPRNARLLEASRRLNGFGQVSVAQMAAARATGLLVLNTSHSNGTTSAPPDTPGGLLGAETVAGVRVDALVPEGRRIDFIKVDVEGAEYTALLGAQATIERWRPTIVSEFSPDLMAGISGVSGPDYLDWIVGRGYTIAVIEPDGTLTAAATDAAAAMAAYRARRTDHIDIVAVPAR